MHEIILRRYNSFDEACLKLLHSTIPKRLYSLHNNAIKNKIRDTCNEIKSLIRPIKNTNFILTIIERNTFAKYNLHSNCLFRCFLWLERH